MGMKDASSPSVSTKGFDPARKFSPGPWSAIEDDSDWYIAGTNGNVPVIIADIEPMFPTKTIEANARLIASAPELYEAAEDAALELESVLGAVAGGDIPLRNLRAVLAKARGDA